MSATATSPSISHPAHIPSLDGFRGLAILLVLVCHAGWWSYGFLGVWLFFVLSGFLISRNLIAATHDTHYYKTFYTKRFFRLMPIYALVCLLTYFLFQPHVTPELNPYVLLSQLFYLQNIPLFLMHPVLAHTWSLAVEEHFYLAFPYLHKHYSQHLPKLLLGVILVANLSRLLITLTLPQSHYIYSLTLCNIDSLAYGVWLAHLEKDKRLSRQHFYKLALTVSLITLPIAFLPSLLGAPSFLTIPYNPVEASSLSYFPVFTLMPLWAVVLLYATLVFKPLDSLFSNQLLRKTGTISYGLYLYHGLLLHLLPKPLYWLPASFLLATLSYYALEAPLLKFSKRRLKSQPPISVASPA